MIKKMILVTLMTFTACIACTTPAKADAKTAAAFMPTMRAMYHIDEAEAVLAAKKAALSSYRKNHASAGELALAQAAVDDASNLVSTLNVLLARDSIILKAAPAGVINPPSFAVNSLEAQGAWNNYLTHELTGHVLIYPAGPLPNPIDTARACSPFCMY
ncbi:MAG: hypothetical protein K6G58_02440 [Lachnospiraceae bacterium]|nr:hypothetical protein [Lachnospiraceae bacterium]